MDIQTFFYYIASVAMGFFIIICILVLFIMKKTSGKVDKVLDGSKEKFEKMIDELGSLLFKVDLIKEAIEGISNITSKRKNLKNKNYNRLEAHKEQTRKR